MDSAIIVSDFLGEKAEEVDAPEKGITFSWSELSEQSIDEDIIILDTKMSAFEDKAGSETAIGYDAYETLEFFRRSLKNLLESGRTVIGLLSHVQNLHASESRTVAVQNYRWLQPFGRSTIERGGGDLDQDFIFEYPDAKLDYLDVSLERRDGALNTYFLNVAGSPIVLYPENSPIKDFEKLAVSRYLEEDVATALVVESWEDDDGEEINPDGRLILLPRPTDLRVDARDWFRSLIGIAHQFTPEMDGVDEFKRIVNRTSTPALRKVYRICHRFPEISRQLENRYSDRPTLEVDDEYDVQDLFHALLWMFFDDIREEENAPSYGGSSPRIDFLIKDETIAIEIKITRSGRGNKKLKSELAEDKEHYRTHPDCETLVCFVYDPLFEVDNPAGFEDDLSESTQKLDTEVIVSSTQRLSGT